MIGGIVRSRSHWPISLTTSLDNCHSSRGLSFISREMEEKEPEDAGVLSRLNRLAPHSTGLSHTQRRRPTPTQVGTP